MFEEFRKSIDKGLDYAFMNAEKLAQVAREFAKENKLTKEEAKKLYDQLAARSQEARKSVEAEMQVMLKNAIKKMNIPSQEDIKKLEDRIKKLEGAKKAPAPVKPVPKAAKTAKPKARK